MSEMQEFCVRFLLSDLRPDIDPDVMLKFFRTDRGGGQVNLYTLKGNVA